MSLTGGHLDAFLSAGLTAEQIVALVKADIEEREKLAQRRRDKDAARQRRHRESRGVTVTDGDNADTVSLDKEKSPRPPKEIKPFPAESSGRAWALPAGVSLQVWQDFKRNRERKRLPNTETAWKTFNDDLKRIAAQTGIPPPELIERCAAKGWASINDPRDGNDRRTNTMGRHQPASDGLSATTRAALKVFGSTETGHQH